MSPHDVPTAAQLVESVREWLEGEVLPVTAGRLQFHARVAINVLAMVQREIDLGPGHQSAHVAGLAGLGCDDDAELAAAIRSGAFDDRLDDVRDVVWATVRDKLAVANPTYAT